MKEFTIEEKAELINLAMKIELGTISLKSILKSIQEEPYEWARILDFWENFDAMTRRVVNLIGLEVRYKGRENV